MVSDLLNFFIFSLKRKAKLTRVVTFIMYYLLQSTRNDHTREGTTTKISGTTIQSFLPYRHFFLFFSLKRNAKITLLSPYVMYDLPQNTRNDHKREGARTKIS